jgi:hypothetical protein
MTTMITMFGSTPNYIRSYDKKFCVISIKSQDTEVSIHFEGIKEFVTLLEQLSDMSAQVVEELVESQDANTTVTVKWPIVVAE